MTSSWLALIALFLFGLDYGVENKLRRIAESVDRLTDELRRHREEAK